MSAAPDIAEPNAPDRDAVHEGMLRRLAEIGMALAELTAECATEVVAADPKASLVGVDLQFSRIAKAVRMTIMLERRLADIAAFKALQPIRVEPWVVAGMTEEAWEREARAEERADQAQSVIEQLIEQEPRDRVRDRLTVDLADRIENDLDEARFVSQAPIGEVIAAICRELGLKPDWASFTDHSHVFEPAELARLRLGLYDRASERRPTCDTDDEFNPPPGSSEHFSRPRPG